MILKDIPIFERPREKIINEGIETLSNIELVAILLRTGAPNKNVLDIAKEIVYRLESLADISELTLPELTGINGIGVAKATTIIAAVELGRRINNITKDNIIYNNSDSVFNYYHAKMKNLKEEHLYAMYLNSKGNLIASKLITKGNVNSTIIDSKAIFKWAYKFYASAIIISHNHPSGDASPSTADLKFTSELVKASKLLGIPIIDHVIIGDTYYSMKKNNQIFKMF